MYKLKEAGVSMAVLYAAAYSLQASNLDLKYFKNSEFGVWFPLMNPELLKGLDVFREALNSPIIVSPAHGSMGRLYNPASQHFPRPLVNAIDVMIPKADLYEAYKTVRRIEIFSGIGVYPNWKPYKGFHLDMRESRDAGTPALWAGLKNDNGEQYYTDVRRAFI